MKNRANPHISIIVLDWNEPDETIECLKSFDGLKTESIELILLENGSRKENVNRFVQLFMENFPSSVNPTYESEATIIIAGQVNVTERHIGYVNSVPLIMLESEKNLGFATGNNIAIEYAETRGRPDLYLLLNNDTRITSELFNEMAEAFEDDKVGICGPKVFNYPAKEDVQSIGARINMRTSNIDFILSDDKLGTGSNGQFMVDYVCGCCMMLRSSLIDRIGLLNEKYFAFWEETDFCFRSKRAGFMTVVRPSAVVYHRGGLTANKSDFSVFLYTRNRFWFMRDNSGNGYPLFLLNYFIRFFLKELSLSLRQARSKAFIKGIYQGIFPRRIK